MKSEHLTNFTIGTLCAIACFVLASGITYDGETLYSQKNTTAIIESFVLIGISAGIYALIQLIKLIQDKQPKQL